MFNSRLLLPLRRDRKDVLLLFYLLFFTRYDTEQLRGNVESYSNIQWLQDGSEYPAEGFVQCFCGGVAAYSLN